MLWLRQKKSRFTKSAGGGIAPLLFNPSVRVAKNISIANYVFFVMFSFRVVLAFALDGICDKALFMYLIIICILFLVRAFEFAHFAAHDIATDMFYVRHFAVSLLITAFESWYLMKSSNPVIARFFFNTTDEQKTKKICGKDEQLFYESCVFASMVYALVCMYTLFHTFFLFLPSINRQLISLLDLS
eukprot:gnl/TRDRNA2_/TRDRNA2_181489_c0_seq1.p1 gnl/TRDRNA2_/TRDRNA2_181489_c0~~gnl/TRDRNA2_/TRDRNA2_181489_c0_seq1.p1  ORF type:complete len:187 (-),score=31.19 gnl/TRDRNA2_/TRDRNA2_181489_c0_seq1:124-684(-)